MSTVIESRAVDVDHSLSPRRFAAATGMLSSRIRDKLTLDRDDVLNLISEVVARMSREQVLKLGATGAQNKALEYLLQRVVIDLGVVLSLAKTFETDEAFVDSAGILVDLDFTEFGGLIGQFACCMVEADLDLLEQPEEAKTRGFYDILPRDRVSQRLNALLEFIRSRTQPGT